MNLDRLFERLRSDSIHHSSFIIRHSLQGFTLLELLVVIAIMGLLGTASVGGYRAMQRGMEERGVMQNVNQFMRAAYQRAQIDRQPVSVYFWNETLREETDTLPAIVVGKAVAVRRSGRVTYREGNYIGDEFADLRFNRLLRSNGETDTSAGMAQSGKGSGVYLYKMNGNEGQQAERSLVAKNTILPSVNATLLQPTPPDTDSMTKNLIEEIKSIDRKDISQEKIYPEMPIEVYAYQLIDALGVTWKIGDAYGFEFAQLELPANYIFGSEFSLNTSNPISGNQAIRFKVSKNVGSGATEGESGTSQVNVSAIRQIGGTMQANSIGTSDRPTGGMN